MSNKSNEELMKSNEQLKTIYIEYNAIIEEDSYLLDLFEVDNLQLFLENNYFEEENKMKSKITKLLKKIEKELEKQTMDCFVLTYEYYSLTLKKCLITITTNKKIQNKFNSLDYTGNKNFYISVKDINDKNEMMNRSCMNLMHSYEKILYKFQDKDVTLYNSQYCGLNLDYVGLIARFSPLKSLITYQRLEKELNLDLYHKFMLNLGFIKIYTQDMKKINSCKVVLKQKLEHEISFRINQAIHQMNLLEEQGKNIKCHKYQLEHYIKEKITTNLEQSKINSEIIHESWKYDILENEISLLSNCLNEELKELNMLLSKYGILEGKEEKIMYICQLFNYLDKFSSLLINIIDNSVPENNQDLKNLIEKKILLNDEPRYRYVQKYVQLLNSNKYGKFYSYYIDEVKELRNTNTHRWTVIENNNEELDILFNQLKEVIISFYLTIESIPDVVIFNRES